MTLVRNPWEEPRRFSANTLKDAFKNVRWSMQGRVRQVVGTIIEASLPGVQLGTIAELELRDRDTKALAEVVGFTKDGFSQLLPYDNLSGIFPGSLIFPLQSVSRIPVGNFLIGRAVDAFLNPLAGPPIDFSQATSFRALDSLAPNPLERQRISKKLSLGVRAIDSMLTFGEGQRVGIVAGSGVGKSVLMGMIARNSDADINVIGLIGERGREVAEFIEKDLSPEGLKRSVIVAVTSDQSPLMRVRGAKVATAIAEHFSSEGKSVMLMLDSLTRVAMSQREIGNAIGEPPTTKGYTPSVFSLLPKLLERAGGQRPGHGPISALYTVLIDGDDFNDPIADAARSILDGHINLTRELATRNHFPAIDITTSCSRVMNDIVDRDHWAMANQLRSYLGTYQQNIDLIQIGAYQAGSNPRLDEAISLMPLIERFLCQDMNLRCTANDALKLLDHVLKGRPVKT